MQNSYSYSDARSGSHAGLRSFFNKVYTMMGLGIGLTSIVSFVIMTNATLLSFVANPVFTIVFAIAFIVFTFFAPKMIFTAKLSTANAFFWIYSALWGVFITPLVASVIFKSAAGGMLVAQAFLVTSITFISMSLIGYTTKKDLSSMAKFLFMAMIGILVAAVINMFIGSGLFSLVISIAVVLVVSGITAYETQAIKNAYFDIPAGETTVRFVVYSAFTLFTNFVTIFVHVLNILQSLNEE